MVMQRSSRILLLWPSVVLASMSAFARADAGERAPDSARLSNLVRQDCGSCHGLTLKGGLGKPLTADQLRVWDRDQLVHIILDGVPATPMPPWRPLLSESDAQWIADRLKQGSLQ